MTREPDIVERLRHRAKSLPPATTEELLEGAAEIERLRAKVNEIDQQLTGIEHLNAREKLELRAEIEQLRRLVDEREADLGRMHGETSAEIERLKAALRPFANAADEFQWVADKRVDPEGAFLWACTGVNPRRISVGDCLRARAALEPKP